MKLVATNISSWKLGLTVNMKHNPQFLPIMDTLWNDESFYWNFLMNIIRKIYKNIA